MRRTRRPKRPVRSLSRDEFDLTDAARWQSDSAGSERSDHTRFAHRIEHTAKDSVIICGVHSFVRELKLLQSNSSLVVGAERRADLADMASAALGHSTHYVPAGGEVPADYIASMMLVAPEDAAPPAAAPKRGSRKGASHRRLGDHVEARPVPCCACRAAELTGGMCAFATQLAWPRGRVFVPASCLHRPCPPSSPPLSLSMQVPPSIPSRSGEQRSRWPGLWGWRIAVDAH
jgi:hypothetical protein